MSDWNPLRARLEHRRPEVGWVVALDHGVWRVSGVRVDELTAGEREKWIADRMPDLGRYGPYLVDTEHIGGYLPPDFDGETCGEVRIGYSARPAIWHRYEAGRWPQCSCCGEPMPCRAELTDRLVDADMKRIDMMASRLAGSCWGCGEPITRRNQAVRYAGENVDLPGGIPVVFHLRNSCWPLAAQYEERWLAADHDRRRLLTYPRCGGTLLTHQDGSQECDGDNRDPECLGVVSHYHGSQAACYAWGPLCRRGCPKPASSEESWGCGRVKRPKLRDPDLPQGRPTLVPGPVKPDSRALCHGTLFTHEDGSGDCRGGLDDCWDGSRYRHERERECRDLSHGCPQCETGAAS